MDDNIKMPEYIYNDHCFACGCELTDENASIWCGIAELNGQEVTVNKCVFCARADEIVLASCIKIDDEFVPQIPTAVALEYVIRCYTAEQLRDAELYAMHVADKENMN